MKKQNQDSIKELGKFYSYYGYDTVVTPSKKNKHNIPKTYKTMSESKFSKKYISPRPKTNNKTKPSNFRRKAPTYYRCGKIGHYSRDCQLENKINSLEVSDELKHLIINKKDNNTDTEKIKC